MFIRGIYSAPLIKASVNDATLHATVVLVACKVVATVGAKQLNAVLSGYGFLITIVDSRQRLL